MSALILRRSYALLTIAFLFTTGLTQAQVTRTWVGGASDSWNLASNWDPTGIPASNDNVIISGTGTIDLGGGPITVADMTLSSKVLSGTSTVTTNGTFTWNSGTLQMAGGFDANGPVSLETTSKYLSTTLDLNNTTTWSGGYFYMTDGAVLNNTAGQTMTATHEGGGYFLRNGAPFSVEPVFNNLGTFIKNPQDVNNNFTTVQGVSSIGVVFNNSGSVQVNLGTPNPTNMSGTSELDLSFAGTSTGSFTVEADAVLSFDGNHTLNGVSISGAGEVDLSPTTNELISFTGAYTYNVTGTTRHSGAGTGRTLFNAGTVTSVGDVIHSGGQLDLQTGGTVSPVTYEQSGGSSILQGTSPVAVSGQMTWKAGTISISSDFDANGPTSLESTTKYLSTTLDLNNTTTWSGGYVYMTDGAVLNNTAGQTMTATHEGGLSTSFAAVRPSPSSRSSTISVRSSRTPRTSTATSRPSRASAASALSSITAAASRSTSERPIPPTCPAPPSWTSALPVPRREASP